MTEELQRMIEQAIVEVLAERRKALGLSAEELGKRGVPRSFKRPNEGTDPYTEAGEWKTAQPQGW